MTRDQASPFADPGMLDDVAWTPAPSVTQHNGESIPDWMEFPFPPPPDIGAILSAASTLKRGKQILPGWVRFAIATAIGMGVWLVVSLVASSPTPRGAVDLAVEFLGAGAGLAVGLAVWYFVGRRPIITFVGREGIARFTMRGPRGSEPRREMLVFMEAAEVRTSQTRHHYNGIYCGTSFEYTWWDKDGRRLRKLSGSYQSKHDTPRANSPFWFASAGEGAWNDWFLPRLNRSLQADGYVQFNVNKKHFARVGPGFIEITHRRMTTRLTHEEVESIRVGDGMVYVMAVGSKWYSSKGKFPFPIGTMGNAKLFLMTLSDLLGHEPMVKDFMGLSRAV